MATNPRHMATKAIRSTLRFGAERVASSDRLMNVVYDLVNETNFAGLAEHEEMLSDRIRVEAYHRAIHRKVSPGDVVLDLGTGTGLLAFMAAKAGAAKVYAVEHSDFIEVAREIAHHNQITNVEFIQVNSRELTLPEPVDVVLHEQMGDELFNENLVDNLLDARDRLLAPGGRMLPARFALFVEPVSFHPAMRVRRFWNIELPDGIDLAPLEHSPVAARFDTGRSEQFWARPGSVASAVSAPAPIVEFDLATLDDIGAIPIDHVVERRSPDDTIVDGACVWFEARFDDDTVLSTSPLGPPTSWGNRVFRIDRELAAGEAMRLYVHLGNVVDPATWTVEVL
ncbi:MAG: methyltransferase domain-containing protein [Acidimicrobiales bacterium]